MRRYHKELIVEDLAKPDKGSVGEAYGWTGTYFDREDPSYYSECAFLSWSWRYCVNGDQMMLCTITTTVLGLSTITTIRRRNLILSYLFVFTSLYILEIISAISSQQLERDKQYSFFPS